LTPTRIYPEDKEIQRRAGRPRKVAVVGAGLSGLVVARELARHGHKIRVFEKSRGPGGRMSTRRVASYAFDHGAQYFTLRDERFERQVGQWLKSGIAALWDGRIRVLKDGTIAPERNHYQRFVGVPRMSAITRSLAQNIVVKTSTRIDRVAHRSGKIRLVDAGKTDLGEFEALVVTAPPSQSAKLLHSHTTLSERVGRVRMDPCWAVMLTFAARLQLPFEGAFVHDSEIGWIARNASKPGRQDHETWVLHATPTWSNTNLDLESHQAAKYLTASFFSAVGLNPIAPVFSLAHQWRYARAQTPLSDGAMWDGDSKIGVCGDWCCGSRIEGAFLSGLTMAQEVLTAFYGT